jgi:AraC-like DNA-binding protein
MKKLSSQCSDKSRYNDALFITTVINCVIELNIAVDTLLSSASHLIQTPKTTDNLLQGMIKYVNNNLTKDIRTEELASHLGVSESYLYRFCKRNLSISLHAYINNQKMQLAVALLNQGFTPQYVAIHLGYYYYTTFFTQFKKVIGRSPSEIVNKVPFVKTVTPPNIKQAFNQSISKYEAEKRNKTT